MKIYSNVLEMVGHTPMLELKRLDTGRCRLFLKLELLNPGGSIKDRIGLVMIAEAEKRGDLKPGGTLVEATAGNTGLGLALVAAQKGYRLILVIPDKMSQEKIFNLRAMGAEVVLTRSDVSKGHPEYYQDLAKRMAAEQGAFFINQFGNPDNVKAHETTTAPEIWEQVEHKLDAVVAGVGSSGTLTGIGHYFRKVAPQVEMVLADPQGSVLAHYIRTGKVGPKGAWLVEGIGEDFVPDICDLSVVKHTYTIPDSEAFATAREVLKKEGLLLGSSSGTLIAAALRYCRAQKTAKRVVTIGADTGNKYLSKLYNDFWMIEQGFMERPRRGDLGDYVGRPYWERATVYVGPADTLATAHTRMRNNGISQLPVIEGRKFLGAVTESDLIHAVRRDTRGFTQEVRVALDTNYPHIQARKKTEELYALLEKETAAAIMQGEEFLGLVTRSDLLNRLRLQH